MRNLGHGHGHGVRVRKHAPLAERCAGPHVGLAMLGYTFVDGFTRVPRDEAIERLKQAIAAADGVIVDFAFFGQEAIRLTVELDVASLAVLRRELDASAIELFPACVAELDAAARAAAKAGPGAASRPVLAMLHVAFAGAEADLAPAVHP